MRFGRIVAALGAAILLAVGASTVIDLVGHEPALQAEPNVTACDTSPTGVVLPLAQYVAPSGILGTSTEDLQGFANQYNDLRIANCLTTVPTANFRASDCIEQRLIWIAEDPSEDPVSAWGHEGTPRSDGAPPVGCDANLAGGPTTTGEIAAEKWWLSEAHRQSLYRPDYGGPTNNVCIDFAAAHGDIPDKPLSFTRAGAVWADCQQYLDQVERRPDGAF